MDIDTQIKTLHENSSPLTSAFSTIFSVTFWGSLLSLFLAFIIKKKVNVGHGSNNDQKN